MSPSSEIWPEMPAGRSLSSLFRFGLQNKPSTNFTNGQTKGQDQKSDKVISVSSSRRDYLGIIIQSES